MPGKKQTIPPLEPETAFRISESIADILNNTIHNYWLSSSDADSAAAECYRDLHSTLEKTNPIAFRIFDGALMVNGTTLKEKSHNIEVLVDHLSELEIDNFTILKDIDKENFSNFLEVLEAHKAELDQLGGFAECLRNFRIKGVETKKLVFQEITEDEVIVDKSEVGSGSGTGPGNEAVGSILAFLKGETPADDKDALKKIQETAPDAAQMAQLILDAAEIRKQETEIEGGESMVDLVVGCLRRTYASLTQQKSAQTKTGRKRITRNLLLLEQEVLSRMRDMAMEWTDDDLQAIIDATQEMTDELMIDSLADEFVSNREKNAEMEKKMMDYIKDLGIDHVDKLKQKLMDKGLDIGDWQELIVKSDSKAGRGPGAGEGMGPGEDGAGLGIGGIGGGLGAGSGFAIGSLIEAIGHLDVVMGNMEKNFASGDKDSREADSNKLVGVLEDITGQVRTITQEAGEQIDSFLDNIHADAEVIEAAENKAREDGETLKLTRKEMLEILSTIVQQICEPLEIVKASLRVIKFNTGGLSQSQQQAMDIAMENTDMISGLLRKLENISGK